MTEKRRKQGMPWSDNPIISTYKFTDAYRASDRTSQYLIRKVLESKQAY